MHAEKGEFSFLLMLDRKLKTRGQTTDADAPFSECLLSENIDFYIREPCGSKKVSDWIVSMHRNTSSEPVQRYSQRFQISLFDPSDHWRFDTKSCQCHSVTYQVNITPPTWTMRAIKGFEYVSLPLTSWHAKISCLRNLTDMVRCNHWHGNFTHRILFSDAAVKQILLILNEKESFIIEDLDDHHVVIKAEHEWRVRQELETEVSFYDLRMFN